MWPADRPLDRHPPLSPLQRAAALGPEIAAAADEIDRTQRFPEPLLTHMHDAGLCRLLLPAALGGDEAHPVDYLDAIMEVARHDGSVGWNMFVANSSTLIAPFIPLESAQKIYVDPRAVIAWGPPNACTLTAVDGGYQVNGTWDFASGCRQATWMGAHAHVIEADGERRLNAAGAPLIRTVLFPVDKAQRHGEWSPLGLRGTASETYTVTDVFVPEAMSGTREQPELRRDRGPLYAFTMHGLYAVGVAGVALGLAGAMLAEFRSLAATKTPRSRSRLEDDVLTQADYARAEAKLGSAYAYASAVLNQTYDNADDIKPIAIEERARVRLICSNAIQSSVEVADWVHRAAGVSAIFPNSPFDRRYRDIHTLSQQIQARAAHFEAVGQVLLGSPPPVFF
jgi:alkylation response protein AidB-like acyl-CoA dehydrogenase